MARGDHIKVRRWGGLYAHHGIDMGDGTVIHLPGEPFRTRHIRVCRTPMEIFLAGGTPIIVDYAPEVRSGEEAAAIAEALMALPGYCVLRNNCEHFATYCKTGRAKSRQVTRALKLGGAAMAAAGTLAASALIARRKRNQRASRS